MNRTIASSFLLLMSAGIGPLLFAEDSEAPFVPVQDVLPAPVSSDGIVLFDENTNLFLSKNGGPIDWKIEQGCLVSTGKGSNTNHIVSQWHFRDADIHVEFATNKKSNGNSGIYIHGHYELQIYHSLGVKDLSEQDEGALYGFAKPLVNASKDIGEWQVYDIRYRSPRRDANGMIIEQGSITAWLNGQKVQDNVRFGEPRSQYHPFRYGVTPFLKEIAHQQSKTSVGPVFLQDHDSPARFRNIWIRPLDDKAILHSKEPSKN